MDEHAGYFLYVLNDIKNTLLQCEIAINGKITFLKSSTSGVVQFNLNAGIEKTTIEIYPDKK
ncbi:hypothetical protein JW964_13985 [candidate division KSB1 bacterium]|nr:hypothetical protein [candidate division KSB1 bacterium]